MSDFTGQTALITGAGSGIGRSVSKRLAAQGATVAVNDIDEESAEDTVAAIESEGGSALTAIADVTDFEAVTAMVEAVVEETGGIDILVNNAGYDQVDWFIEQDPSVWDRIIDINFRGQLNCARVAGAHMVDRGEGGRIVNIASDAGRAGSMGEAVYSGTKGAIVAFTKSLALELARDDITCNVVAPGPTDTPMARSMQEESELGESIFGSMESQIPLGRLIQPEEIAAAIEFFAQAETAMVTGQVLSVSGGLTMVD